MMRIQFRCAVLALAVGGLMAAFAAPTQRTLSSRNGQSLARNRAPATVAATQSKDSEVSDINWIGAELDVVFEAYSRRIGKTILKDPGCPTVQITLKSRPGQKLTDPEWLEAVETILEMNQIHLEPYGESFIRALPRKDVRKEGIPLIMDAEAQLRESTRVVSLMIPFKNLPADEAQKILEGLKSNSGVLLVFERTNSILVTDTEQNINRMLEIVRSVDVATPVTENVFHRQIRYASATEIKTALEAIVQDSQKELEKNGKQVNAQAASRQPQTQTGSRLLGGRNQRQPTEPVNNASLVMAVSDADRGMIRGKVLILADERSNKLIIVTSKANMDFFDNVIEQLDIETTPDTVVKVYRLKYADAEDVSDMINDLIGNAASSKGNSKGNQNQNAKSGSGGNLTHGAAQTAKKPANQRTGEAKAGELSKENTTVLADKRINGIVVMTMKELVPVLEAIIESMDVKLSQVLIETMILQVQLNHETATGIDWFTKFLKKEAGGGISGGGGTTGSTAQEIFLNGAEQAMEYATLATPVGAGINSAMYLQDLNIGAVIKAAQTDSQAKLVASPIIMTVDNKEATIECTRMRYLLKGYTYSGSTYNGSAVPDYEQKEIGLTVKVTPKINPNGTVMLKVEEEFSSLGESQTIQAATGGTTNSSGSAQQSIGGIQVETTVTRKLSADITVDNRQTVILGGLSQTEKSQEENGIPILKDIPWIGRYLFASTKDVESRQELLMFLTPYVLDDAESAVAEARRRKRTLSDAKPWDDHGWSASPLADPVSLKEQLNRKVREWKQEDAEYESQLKLDEKNQERVDLLKERAEEATEKRAKEAKAIVTKINEAEEKKDEARVQKELKTREENADFLQQLKEESTKGAEGEKTKKPAAEVPRP